MKIQELFEAPGKSLATKNPSAADLIDMFSTINVDCKKSGEVVVKLTDEEYYAEQIANIFEVNEAKAAKLAKAMADEVKKRVEDGSLPSEYGSKMKANKSVIK